MGQKIFKPCQTQCAMCCVEQVYEMYGAEYLCVCRDILEGLYNHDRAVYI